MKVLVPLDVNGETHEVAVPPNWTLLEALRYALNLTGSKQGCDKGDCGACTVMIDGEAKLSCLTLAVAARGHKVVTIEGLADKNELDPVQEAFDECGALQCGFCQSGMMISARCLLDSIAAPTLDQVRLALSGNLCRCTGYTKIFDAVARAQELEREREDTDPGEEKRAER